MTTYYDRQPNVMKRTTRFMAVGKEDEEGKHPVAHVDLVHEAEKSNYFMGHPVNAVREGEPTEFFKHVPAEIHSVFSDPTMTSHIPTLLGIAGEQSMRETGGRLPMPSHSLSKHSSRMVQSLRDRGVDIPVNPKNESDAPTNAYDKKPQRFTMEELGSNTLPTPLSQVRSGRELMRSMLRPKAQNINENQFRFYNDLPVPSGHVQPTLPGMEKPAVTNEMMKAYLAKAVRR